MGFVWHAGYRPERIRMESVEDIMVQLAECGIVTSIAFGPSREEGNLWSVTCMDGKTGEEFFRPFAAGSMMHAAQIARKECLERGWAKRRN